MDPWQNISLCPDEIEAFPPLAEEPDPTLTTDWWLVGRVLTHQSINNRSFKSMVTNTRKTKHGFEARDISRNLFTFRFFAEQDRQNIQQMGPWNFNHNLIIMKEMNLDENPKEVDLSHTLFWVRVYDLTMNLRTEQMAMRMGKFLGKYVSWDDKDE